MTWRITVLISGSGTNLQALIDATSSNGLLSDSAITHVISSRSNVHGLERAAHAQPRAIPTQVCALKTFLNKVPGSTRDDYDRQVARLVLESKPDLVVLAGWMHILSPTFLEMIQGGHQAAAADAQLPPPSTESFPCVITNPTEVPTYPPRLPIPIINLHPALPGAFDGANAIGRAYEAFQRGEIKGTGVMVHEVVAEVDQGQPLVVKQVDIKSTDSLEDLENRIHEVEHGIIVQGARIVLDGLSRTSSS